MIEAVPTLLQSASETQTELLGGVLDFLNTQIECTWYWFISMDIVTSRFAFFLFLYPA